MTLHTDGHKDNGLMLLSDKITDYFKLACLDKAKTGFFILAIACLLLLPWVSMDAGITEDEREHLQHGHRLLQWYLGQDHAAGESPFDHNGAWQSGSAAINIYGGFFDLLAAALHQFLSPATDEYQFKHGLTALFGAVLFILTGLLARRVYGSWLAGLLALTLAVLSPRLFGHALNNPKDLPFATFYCFSLWQIASFLQELPSGKWTRYCLLAISFSFAIAVRSGGVLLIAYFLLFGFAALAWQLKGKAINSLQALKQLGLMAGVAVSGYLGTALLWPWAMGNPIVNPWLSLGVFRKFNALIFTQLFEGNWIDSAHLPWHFAPKWIYITTPLPVLVGLVLFFVLLPVFLAKDRRGLPLLGLLAFAAAFPVASVIVGHSNLYDTARHLLFTLPPMIALAALAWTELFGLIRLRPLQITVGMAFLLALAEPLHFMLANHPLQALYFSPVIDGTKGAFRNYELDYYGFSVRKAYEWIEQDARQSHFADKARVRLWYGDNTKLKHFTEQSQSLLYVIAPEASAEWDYSITMTVEAKYNHDLLFHWPPPGTVHQVLVDGTPVSAVVKNLRLYPSTDRPVSSLEKGTTHYRNQNYDQAIIQLLEALKQGENNNLVLMYLAASFTALKMYDDAIGYAEMGLMVNPNYPPLEKVLTEAKQGKSQLVPSEAYFIGLSYHYYQQGNYIQSIATANKALAYNANDSDAWNNIAAAYGSLGQYDKEIEACDRALAVNPDNGLAQRNKAWAIQQKAGKP